MPQLSTRGASEGDAHGIARLLAELGHPLPEAGVIRRIRKYRETGGLVWVAELESRIVGFLSFHRVVFFHAEGFGGRITAMCVDSECRRQGVGRALLRTMEIAAKELGCERIEVTSGDHREGEAHRFYEAQGYALSKGRFLKDLKNTEPQ